LGPIIRVRPETKRIWHEFRVGRVAGERGYISERKEGTVEEHHDPEHHEETSECREGDADF
jgi:hypothetical protein